MELQKKDIKGYEGLYTITNTGLVYSERSRKYLKPGKSHNGYLLVSLCKDGKTKSFRVHRLVAEAFIDNPDELETVDHINHNRTDNRAENLRWMSREENSRDGGEQGGTKCYCEETDRYYPSIKLAAEDTGCSVVGISNCCTGRQKSTYGMHFCYAFDRF